MELVAEFVPGSLYQNISVAVQLRPSHIENIHRSSLTILPLLELGLMLRCSRILLYRKHPFGAFYYLPELHLKSRDNLEEQKVNSCQSMFAA